MNCAQYPRPPPPPVPNLPSLLCECSYLPPLLFRNQGLLRVLKFGDNLLNATSIPSTAFAGLLTLDTLVRGCCSLFCAHLSCC